MDFAGPMTFKTGCYFQTPSRKGEYGRGSGFDGRSVPLPFRLRAERPDLPVVVVTGYPPPDGAVSLQAGRGPLRLLAKPIGITPLIAAIRDAAGQDR